jgi:hypothetical protein
MTTSNSTIFLCPSNLVSEEKDGVQTIFFSSLKKVKESFNRKKKAMLLQFEIQKALIKFGTKESSIK